MSENRNINRVIDAVSIKFLGKKIKNLIQIKEYFKHKTGLEIGGPSQIFSNKGYIPIYNLATEIDGCNFSNETV